MTLSIKTTAEIIAQLQLVGKLYPSHDASDFWISSTSRWTDRKWILDGLTPGASLAVMTISWDVVVSEGKSLLDSDYSSLLDISRHFLWGMLTDRREGRRLKANGMAPIWHGLKKILRWMIAHNYANFGELDRRAFERFTEWMVDSYVDPSRSEFSGLDGYMFDSEMTPTSDTNLSGTGESPLFDDPDENMVQPSAESEPDGVGAGIFRSVFAVWDYFWQQRLALKKMGIESIQFDPFRDSTVNKLATSLATKAYGRIPALPDTIAIPVMNAAYRLIEVASDDLIKLIPLAFALRNYHHGYNAGDASVRINSTLAKFPFSIPVGEAEPWRKPLGLYGASATEQLRQSLDDTVDACTITIQAETGMRISEVCSLLAGMDANTGLPSCVEMRVSKSGMLDLFYIKSTLHKMRLTPTKEEWLLAARPRNSEVMPSAVKAVIVLQKLLQPFREIASEDVKKYLIVTVVVPNGLPKDITGVSGPSQQRIRNGQKTFMDRYVDWDAIPNDRQSMPYKSSRGKCASPHQWRKTYAQFVFQVDKRLLPAIARQFKHLSVAMTEGAYVGTSIGLVQGVADHNRNMTVDLLLLNARGVGPKHEGRLAKLMEQYQPQLADIIDGMNDREARDAMAAWCDARDMKLFFHGYGKCVPAIAPTEAECHKRAGTVHWANTSPNYERREPSVCTGCQLFLAGPEHLDYWNDRYVKNMTAWMNANDDGQGYLYRVAKARADQSLMYLTKLGAEIPSLENRNAW
jgi:integrase